VVQCGLIEMASGGTGIWWPVMVVVVIDGGNLGGYVGDLVTGRRCCGVLRTGKDEGGTRMNWWGNGGEMDL
jgi:hypothetical protein